MDQSFHPIKSKFPCMLFGQGTKWQMWPISTREDLCTRSVDSQYISWLLNHKENTFVVLYCINWKKNMHISEPAQFKPMLFMGQLCIPRCCVPCIEGLSLSHDEERGKVQVELRNEKRWPGGATLSRCYCSGKGREEEPWNMGRWPSSNQGAEGLYHNRC